MTERGADAAVSVSDTLQEKSFDGFVTKSERTLRPPGPLHLVCVTHACGLGVPLLPCPGQELCAHLRSMRRDWLRPHANASLVVPCTLFVIENDSYPIYLSVRQDDSLNMLNKDEFKFL